jgi:NAD(P)-dependent dehydrogenase (short-subunit alcohol dehydrogenase family)
MNTDLASLLIHDLELAPDSCAGQVVIVTGAGGGIGLQTARAFALLGAQVVLAELNESGLVAEKQILAGGGQALFVQTDVSDAESIKHLYETTRSHFGPATILVNNAIFIRESALLDIPLADWDRCMAVNLRGAFLTCRTFLPDMLEKQQGVIINMVSMDAMPGLSAYIASKQGITGLSQTLALEVESRGVRVVPFAPGMVDTPGIHSVAEGLAPRLGLSVEQFLSLSLHAAYNGLMPAEHAAAATVYLALHLADEFNGQVVNGYEVLERAGLLQAVGEVLVSGSVLEQPGQQPIELLEKLACMLRETGAEFNQLPVFVRPIARQGFKSKTGLSLPDWQRLLAGLQNGSSSVPQNFNNLLKQLIHYFKDVPKETARFTRDEEMLKEVSRLSRERIAVIEQLINKK